MSDSPKLSVTDWLAVVHDLGMELSPIKAQRQQTAQLRPRLKPGPKPKPHSNGGEWYSTKEAAERIGIGDHLVRKWIREGHIKGERITNRQSRSGYVYRVSAKEADRVFETLKAREES